MLRREAHSGPVKPGTRADRRGAAPPAEAELLAASAPVVAGLQFALLPARAGAGLQVRPSVACAISVMFPEIKPSAAAGSVEMASQRLRDGMIPNYHAMRASSSATNRRVALATRNGGAAPCDLEAGFYRASAAELTADYGTETANHFDHVHIATEGGGYRPGRNLLHRSCALGGRNGAMLSGPVVPIFRCRRSTRSCPPSESSRGGRNRRAPC